MLSCVCIVVDKSPAQKSVLAASAINSIRPGAERCLYAKMLMFSCFGVSDCCCFIKFNLLLKNVTLICVGMCERVYKEEHVCVAVNA